ncbi:inositol-3-phosphate synthase [Agromyces sp. C10]|jgi:myo-inositol-1-phosphate synthase|uniref:inositol-3-phosphate synthase n=1 Tax=Agromyces sp. C10 TaxID=2935077 RepID=UPI00200A8B88|nr:inositol-3-phosphate synthase [Agromyces sp. C10]MCK8608465.1 inositol-3-phosphate synthase [Agromyces sp. C10]
MNEGRTGIWFVGARGSVATTAAIGLAALVEGRIRPVGLTTAAPDFDDVALPEFADLVVGGHDVDETPLLERARRLAAGGMIAPATVEAVAARLDAIDGEIRPVPREARGSQRREIGLRADDIRSFRERHGLRRVVVIDVASTEPLPADRPEFHDRAALDAALDEAGRDLLPSSTLSALAALEAGSPYACFTPSISLGIPALQDAAAEAGVPVAGQDGKTGETLLRTVLAPMFASRGMRVLSWAGANLLGGGDGATLADPAAVQSKLVSKNRGLHDLLGHDVVTPLHIDNVPDLGDVKTAWDHVHAEGFLDTRITLQTTWTAYDSTLAAPLVIDLARLLSLAHEAGLVGPVPELGYFFKDPWGSDVHAFARQADELVSWALRTAVRRNATQAA